MKSSEMKVFVEEARIEYQKIINDTNNDWNKLYSSFFPFVTTINKAEQNKRCLFLSKIDEFLNFKKFHYRKMNIGDLKSDKKYAKDQFEKYSLQNGTSLHTRISAMSNLNLSFDQAEKPVEKFISYERFKQELTQETNLKDKFMLVENVEDLTKNEKINLNFIINDIYNNKTKELKVFEKITEKDVFNILEKDQAILKFLMDSQTLLTNSEYIFSVSKSKFDFLVNIITFIITNTIKNDYLKIGKVEKILEIINRVHFIENSKRVFLYSKFENSLLWKDIDMWINLYEKIVSKKLKNMQDKNKQKKNIFNLVTNLIKKENNGEINETLECKKNILQVVVFYLQNLKIGLGLELATEIIAEIAKNNELDTNYIASILDDFENDFILSKIQCSLNKKNNKKLSLIWKRNIGFKIAFEYLSTTKEKFNLSLICKDVNKFLLPKMKKNILYSFPSQKIRMMVWGSVLSLVN